MLRAREFAERMGTAYATGRNFDLGNGNHTEVSRLSPYISRRIVTEWEVYSMALEKHGSPACDKFCQEILWRTYWRGWLERRPWIWEDYRTSLQSLIDIHQDDRLLIKASQGATDIVCFNDWAVELVTSGYLHNHARMWFASIWIYTLKLPWQLGADFFLRHLLDGDAASNTLSWRWVAGLQTKGKQYLATQSNIYKYTRGRYKPEGLAECCFEIVDVSSQIPEEPLYPVEFLQATVPMVLVIYDEDLCYDISQIKDLNIKQVVGLAPVLSRQARSERVSEFQNRALWLAGETLSRSLGAPFQVIDDIGRLFDILPSHSFAIQHVCFYYPHVGPWTYTLAALRDACETKAVSCTSLRRPWDEALEPLADRGFFPFKEKAVSLIDHRREELGVRA